MKEEPERGGDPGALLLQVFDGALPRVYGYVLGKWPPKMEMLRTGFIRTFSKTPWFDHGLNRGARHVPVGYPTGLEASMAPATSVNVNRTRRAV